MARRQSIQALLLTLSLVTPGGIAHAAPADLPTVEGLQKMLDDKDYQSVVKDASRLAAVKRDAAETIDRYAVLMLKGEAHLQLKQFQPASKAYESAADEEKATEEQKNTALAMSLLSRRSTAAGYQAGGKGEQLDIFKPDNRKAAFKLLFDAELATVNKTVEKAKKTTSLPPIATAANDVRELRGLEMAASDNDDKTKAILTELATHAADTIDKAVADMTDRAAALSKSANKETRKTRMGTNGAREDYFQKRGLTSSEMGELKTMRSNCESLVPLLKKLETALGDAAPALTTVQPKVEALYLKAEEILKADYSASVR